MDGTLTEARQPIDPTFKTFMHEFAGKNSCYVVTGSNYEKVEEQLGDLVNIFAGTYACSGNQLIKQGNETHKNNWQLNGEQEWFLLSELDSISYPYKTGKHLEKRTGSANLSIPGRNATLEDRQLFVTWDQKYKARIKLAEKFNNVYPHLEAVLGGETGIDIFQRGKDKAQIVEHFEKSDTLHFFGDRCDPGGNDFTIAEAVKASGGVVHQVENWQQTHSILQDM